MTSSRRVSAESSAWTCSLSEAHRNGLVHRDIKIDNIWLCDPTSNSRRVVLIDFGLTKVLQGGPKPAAVDPPVIPTDKNTFVGSARYASPEQARLVAVNTRSDIYSVGLVLWTMLMGREPFTGIADIRQLLLAHVLSSVEPIKVRSSQTPAIQAIIDRALEKEPEDRFSDVLEFLDAIAAIIDRTTAPVGILLTERIPVNGPPNQTPATAPADPPPPSASTQPPTQPEQRADQPAQAEQRLEPEISPRSEASAMLRRHPWFLPTLFLLTLTASTLITWLIGLGR